MPDEPHSQRGREGMTAAERDARRAEGSQSSMEREIRLLREQITKLEARLSAVERGDQLQAGNGIIVNGNLISNGRPMEGVVVPPPTGVNQFLGSPNGFWAPIDSEECP